MDGIDPRAVISAISGGLLIVTMLIAFSTFDRARRGEITLVEAIVPWWKDLALAYPTAFGLLVVLGVLVIGGPVIALLEA